MIIRKSSKTEKYPYVAIPPAPPAPSPFTRSQTPASSQSQADPKKQVQWNRLYDQAADRIQKGFPGDARKIVIDNELNVKAQNSQGKTLFDIADKARRIGNTQAWKDLMDLLK